MGLFMLDTRSYVLFLGFKAICSGPTSIYFAGSFYKSHGW